MSKFSRFIEATKEGSVIGNRESMKRWGANKIASQRDFLSERQFMSNIHFMGGLQDVCFKAGKSNNWIFHKVYSLAN